VIPFSSCHAVSNPGQRHRCGCAAYLSDSLGDCYLTSAAARDAVHTCYIMSHPLHTAAARVKNLALASSLAERQSAILYISGDSTSHARWPGVEPQLRSKFQLSHIILHLPSHWSNMLPIHYTTNRVS